MTKNFSGYEIRVGKLNACNVDWYKKKGQWQFKEVPGSDFTIEVDLVMLAMGFVHVAHQGLVKHLQLKLDPRGNVEVNNYQTSCDWVFAAGDTVSGASLVVRAIDSGRRAAAAIHRKLMES